MREGVTNLSSYESRDDFDSLRRSTKIFRFRFQNSKKRVPYHRIAPKVKIEKRITPKSDPSAVVLGCLNALDYWISLTLRFKKFHETGNLADWHAAQGCIFEAAPNCPVCSEV